MTLTEPPTTKPTRISSSGPLSIRHNDHDPQANLADGTPTTKVVAMPTVWTSSGTLFDGYLCLVSDSLDDMETLRIATENRIRALTRSEVDSDGEIRGLGLDARSPEVARAIALLEGIKALEAQGVKDLQSAFKSHPLHPFVKATKGLGEKQTARLLAAIGDPYWNDLYGRPRTVSELWAYCGLAVAEGHAQRRRRGQVSNWSDDAKKRVWLIAQSCIKSKGPYRAVYNDARAKYADAVHPHDCVRCGPAGRPALAGTPLSLGHQHARATRLMCKAILRDLWIAAGELRLGEIT